MRAKITRKLLKRVHFHDAEGRLKDLDEWKKAIRSVPQQEVVEIYESESLDAGTDEGAKAILVAMDAMFRKFDENDARLLLKQDIASSSSGSSEDTSM